MITSYKKYKDTGIEFIGSVPEKWEAKRIKFGVNSLTGFAFKSNEYKDKGIKLVRGINVKEAVLNWDDTKYWDEISPALKRYFLIPGDVLIQMDGSKVGKNYCIISEADLPILLVQRVTRLRTKKTLNSKFLFYTIACQNFFNWVSISKTDPLVPHITLKDIENYAIALPPLEEQIEIALYLDTKTKAIDKKINLLTQKSNFYKELRKRNIDDAVGRGLNNNAKFVSNEFGSTPSHWRIGRLKDISKSMSSGATPLTNISAYYENGILNWVNTGDLNDGIINECQYKISEVAIKDYPNLKINKAGTLLIAMYGATICKIGLLNIEATTNQACCCINFKKDSDSKFVFYWFLANKNKIISLSVGGTQPNISQGIISKLFIAIPPLEEQISIAEYLDEKIQKIDAIVTNIGKQIENLKELRKTLINDVVTGKIKVI